MLFLAFGCPGFKAVPGQTLSEGRPAAGWAGSGMFFRKITLIIRRIT
jgi:hypothetical protein